MLTELLDLNNSRILLVDDEIMNLEIIQELLEDAGYNNIIATSDPENAVDIYKKNVLDLVLLDINMPMMTGFEVMAQFNEVYYPLPPPILILTAQGDKKTLLKALNSGARDFLRKPFDFEEIILRVRNLLEMHLAHKEILDHTETLEKVVNDRTKALLESQKEIIERLGFAAEYKDTETSAHTIRVGHYAQTLAIALGLNQKESEQLLLAAPMHDIGKIGIPDKILLKKGKLDKEEWGIMKKHTQIGYDIMQNSKCTLLKNAGIIALTHHEKWDGSGYPFAIKGTDIHLFGRITAIADVFDALMMKRPYKEAWPLDKVLQLLNNESGKHFDPEIVHVFNKVLDDILMIREKYSN
jgi:putative two-component system response regulator